MRANNTRGTAGVLWHRLASGLWLWLLTAVLTVGCSNHDEASDSTETASRTVAYKVAVILEKEDLFRWKQTADWALKNLSEAQRGLKTRVSLELEYKDQEADDIDDYMHQVANDTTIKAIIGPCTSRLAERMASTLGNVIEQHTGNAAYQKPMISPSASDVEYQRRFSGKDYVWNMSECDITQIEIILSSVAKQFFSQLCTVTLLAPVKGNELENSSSYSDWFGFIAEEYGINLREILTYRDTTELRAIARSLPEKEVSPILDKLVFIPSCVNDVLVFDNELNRTTRMEEYNNCKYPCIFCTDMFVTPTVAQSISSNPRLNYEGFGLYAVPESGFSQAYRQHFHDDLVDGESQFYDAVCLLAFAAARSQYSGRTLNQSVLEVVDGNSGSQIWSCYTTGMRQVFQQLQAGITPNISGATGPWLFDPKYHTNRMNSVYRHWRFYQGKFVTTNYVTSEGTAHSTSLQDTWNWKAQRLQTFEDKDGNISYLPLNERWAFLIAASKGWGNYRFQADVLAMYHILLNHGYDKDHIVLIAEDDLAYNVENKNDRGAVRIIESGENIYDPSAIDYKLSAITTEDIGDILTGNSSEKLRKVLKPTPEDNVFIFWSGHGMPRQLDFGDDHIMTYTKMKDILSRIPHRKMLVTLEACYGGGLGKFCEGIPGTLFLTAASPYEECHATRWSNRIGIYLTNSFSEGFQESVAQNPHVSFRDLYYSLARTVSGSHVKMFNLDQYGSIYRETMGEYLK